MPYGYAYASSRRALRYRLTLLLHAEGRPLSVVEMLEHLEAVGRRPPERASKVVSDSLRWEVGRGRVRRIGRGVYSAARLDPKTRWWLSRQLQRWDETSPSHTHVVERVSDNAQIPDWLQELSLTRSNAPTFDG